MVKKVFFWFLPALLLVMVLPSMAQDRNNEDEVVHLDPRSAYRARDGQVIVKFRDYSTIRVSSQNRRCFATPASNLRINAVLSEFNVDSIEQMLPDFRMPVQARRVKSYAGGDVVETDLSQLYLITLGTESRRNQQELMEELNALDEVEFAEPNYIVYALGAPEGAPVSQLLGEKAVHEQKTAAAYLTNDPMYVLQWGIPACNLQRLLGESKIRKDWRPIIAIIDTGVDIDHPDLKANIWTNTSESGGAEGADDDNNGFTDDIHGWDFVNKTGEMHDFNSHGTHCAGIAAAVGNNGIGIAGACPDARIMPVAVLQSDGTGDIATIIKGINYAVQNSADIISMSFGTYTYSLALEQALAHAYQTAVLVAAAGNDGAGIDPRCALLAAPMFPAAFTFVLGVQATTQLGGLALFSNYDCDGPAYSQYGEEKLYNYELSAPGVGAMSTVPGGQYRAYNGTSMACPLVAGGIASLLQRKTYATKEMLFGDLINCSPEFGPVNFWSVYTMKNAPAILQLVSVELNDTAYGDSSMYADAGERLQLYPTVRTLWGATDSVKLWLEFQEYEDTGTVHILQNHVGLGRPISAYAKAKAVNPIDIRIDSGVVDGRRIRLRLCASSPQMKDILRHDFTIQVTNGVKLRGMLTHNDTLWPNVQYLITDNFAIVEGAELVIKPGVTIKIKDNVSISNAGKIYAVGTPDSMITFTKTDLGGDWGTLYLNAYDTISYAEIESNNLIYFSPKFSPNIYVNGAVVSLISSPIISNSIVHGVSPFYYLDIRFSNIMFDYKILQSGAMMLFGYNYPYHGMINNINPQPRNNNYFIFNNGINIENAISQDFADNHPVNLNILNTNRGSGISLYTQSTDVWSFAPRGLYLGTSKASIAKQHIWDFDYPNSGTFGHIDLKYMETRPLAEAHGIVWKVLVNGYDAQDEFDKIIPLGVGTHEFKVYFNRAMDTSVTPMLSMGVRPPYTQTAIGENTYWSPDSTIYTAHITLNGRSAIDGLNRIYVDGARDNEHFEIPYEDQRFNVYISSSGSLSAGFQATPGIGKVNLEWNDQEVNYEDFLGFNLYRYQYEKQLTNYHYDSEKGQYVYDTITAPGDTLLLNSRLIQDTIFTDFNVVPGERYYYFYKILSTSLTENSPSKTVSCVPNSTIRGDANGSYKVDIADVITTINYVTGQDPQPFLKDAADVNGDSIINILDIVGIINLILHPEQKVYADDETSHTAVYTVENGILYIHTPVALGGMQFSLSHCDYSEIEILDAMKDFEIVHVQQPDSSLSILAYSMSGMQIPAGKTALLRIGSKRVDEVLLSDPKGHNVIALNGDATGMTDVQGVPAQIMKAFPNPFESEVQIEFVIGQDKLENCRLVFCDVLGRIVDAANLAVSGSGKYSYRWHAKGLPGGVYFATLYVNSLKAHTVKLILK